MKVESQTYFLNGNCCVFSSVLYVLMLEPFLVVVQQADVSHVVLNPGTGIAGSPDPKGLTHGQWFS